MEKKMLSPKSERGTKESEENKTHASKAQQLKREKKKYEEERDKKSQQAKQSYGGEGLSGDGQESLRKRRPSHDSNLSRGCVMGVDALQNSQAEQILLENKNWKPEKEMCKAK